MKLLLDENLSRRLVPFLQAAYPGSSQVAMEGLERSDDRAIWEFARQHGFTIVTKDVDFYDLSLVRGAPPHVIWLHMGNADKATVLRKLSDDATAIAEAFDRGLACVELGD